MFHLKHNIVAMGININLINTCQQMHSAIEQTQDLLAVMEQPRYTDKSLIEPMHELLQEHYSGINKSTAVRAEMLVLLYLFAPSNLIQKKQKKFQIMTDIAGVMGLKRNNAYMYKNTLLDFYRLYKDFRDVVDEGMRLIVEAYPQTKV